MQNNTSEIGVSICCITYNQANYISKCLDGFLMQKTDFAFEVIVHDDASTDGTAEIVLEYAKKYPEIIRAVCQNQNQYSQGKDVFSIIELQARGKYIARCEGDDYWTDTNKLQQQYDALEMHPNCHFCVHRVAVVNETGELILRYWPTMNNLGTGIIVSSDFRHILDKEYAFQTSCFFMRSEMLKKFHRERPEFRTVSDVGDEPTLLYFSYIGDVYYIDSAMSAYRTQSKNSWNAQNKINISRQLKHNNCMMQMFTKFEEYTNYTVDLSCRKEKLEFGRLLICKEYRSAIDYMKTHERITVAPKLRLYIFINAFFPRVMTIYKKIRIYSVRSVIKDKQ